MNLPNSFWSWSANDPTEDLFTAALSAQPRIVLVETHYPHNEPISLESPKVWILTKSGYRLTNTFCGAKPTRLQEGEDICHLVFQHFDSSHAASANPYHLPDAL
jgi:hypothetical protein